MKKSGLTLFLFIIIFSANVYPQSKVDKNFEELASDILDNLQKFYPVEASEKGIHKYDYLLTDYSGSSIRDEIARLKNFEKRLYKYNNSNLNAENKIDQKLLKSNVDIALQDLSKIKWHQRNPYMYVNDAVQSIYYLLLSEHAPLSERVQNIIARMKSIPDLFGQARKNLKNPPPVYLNLAREMTTTGIDFFNSVKGDLSKKFPELAREINNATDRVIMSLREYDSYLAGLTPGDETSFAIGKNDFDYKLQHEYFLDFDSDSLLKIGESLFKEADSAYKAYDAWLDVNDPVDSIFVIDCITKQDVLEYYRWELNQVKQFLVDNDILTIPKDVGQCKIMETPEVFWNVIGGIAYQMPGSFNPDQTGFFYIRPIPENLNNEDLDYYNRRIQERGFRRSVVHEAFPGHHLQQQIAGRNKSEVRKWQDNLSLIEGWALYCEEMVYQNGLYGNNKRAFLKVLDGIRFRAARIILDVKLQTGQITRADAVEWLVELNEGYEQYARSEINWYVLNPTYPMCYLIGKTEILGLLDDYKKKKGDNFSLKNFHDDLLAEGSIPIPLIRESWGLGK